MAYDLARRRTVIYGGQGAVNPLDDTWVLYGLSWHRVA